MEPTRLNKYISHNTTYSRREADALISEGVVSINGNVVTDLSTKVKRGDKVEVKGRPVSLARKITVIVYNKAKGELVTKKDDRGRKTIYDTLPEKFKHFIPVGRLDFATEGLLLLTDSPPIAHRLMESNLERVYNVKIKGPVTQKMINAMEQGLELEDATAGGHEKSSVTSMTFAPFYAYQVKKSTPTYSTLKIAITEGQNREVRRFFAAFDAEVVDLKRISYGGITLSNLPTGKQRFLEGNEYKNLRAFLDSIEKEAKWAKKK